MRILHLSDIHLSKDNYFEFKNNFKRAFINDVKKIQDNGRKIDLLVITGDLVDKGGHSLKKLNEYEENQSPYDFFNRVFLQPIIEEIKIDKNKVLFIPGNHDVDEAAISWKVEKELTKSINNENINDYLTENLDDFKNSKRIKAFKEFEKDYHNENLFDYEFTENHSSYVFKITDKLKIGFLLINDSWRCKSEQFKDENGKLYFGCQQIYDSLEYLEKRNTHINICLLHHSLDDYAEKNEIMRILNNDDHKIDIILNGHYHKDDFYQITTNTSQYINLRAKAFLNKPNETHIDYIPGYQIVDIDLVTNQVTNVLYRNYNYDGSSFIDNPIPTNGKNFKPIEIQRLKGNYKGLDGLNEKEFRNFDFNKI